MVEPAAGGLVGSIGLPPVDLLHAIEPSATAAAAIRQIGELRIREKNPQLYCRTSSPAFTRMAYSGGGQRVDVLKRVRTIATTAAAPAIGIVKRRYAAS